MISMSNLTAPAGANSTSDSSLESDPAVRVGLFVTCLVDLFRPSVGFASVELLEKAGCTVAVPEAQSCCGQPAYNSGDNDTTIAIARQVIASFETYDYVVAPSGSCAAMLKEHYPAVLADDQQWQSRASALAEKTFELMSFLTEVRRFQVDPEVVRFDGSCTYHDSCSGLRELGVHQQPRQLLQRVRGLKLTEMKDSNVCCGFGGTFCIKYPDISSRMVIDKTANIADAGTDTVVGGDLGCLMNIAGRLSRENSSVRVYHVAEIVSGIANKVAPIADNDEKPDQQR